VVVTRGGEACSYQIQRRDVKEGKSKWPRKGGEIVKMILISKKARQQNDGKKKGYRRKKIFKRKPSHRRNWANGALDGTREDNRPDPGKEELRWKSPRDFGAWKEGISNKKVLGGREKKSGASSGHEGETCKGCERYPPTHHRRRASWQKN